MQCNTNNKCKDFPSGSFIVTFAEDQQERFLVIIETIDLIEQGVKTYFIYFILINAHCALKWSV